MLLVVLLASNTLIFLVLGVLLVYGLSFEDYFTRSSPVSFLESLSITANKTIIRAFFFVVGTVALFYFICAVFKKKYPQRQIRREVMFSIITLFVNGLVIAIPYYLWTNNYLTYYHDISEFSFWYIPLSIFVGLLIYDLNFYLTHRLLHTQWMFKKVHILHHKSRDTSILSAFSLHPLEALLINNGTLVILICMPLLMPTYDGAMLLLFLIIYTNAFYIHLGIELIPEKLRNKKPFNYLNSYSSHQLHHKGNLQSNYGNIFSIWDRLFRTRAANRKNTLKL